ncbi:MAG: ABC transporter ATP-binding protein [Anaerolineales bacterium]|nr:ABC transporter ATP-binding protein [Anaerolineales bacterium]
MYLELKHIHKAYGASVAVEDFNLSVNTGEFISFLGPSGCGKTTTLRMIAGFEVPTSGHITINGNDITHLPSSKRNVGMVFQSYALFPNMTVAENIGYGLKIAGKNKPDIAHRVEEMLALIHLESFGTRYPAQLSGGQQQRVALARALAFHPQVLLLDEPLSALDAKIRVELRHEIRRIQQQLGITTIYVTHDQEEALSLSDRVVVMSKGRIEQVGTPFEIYNYPRTVFVASFVGTLNQLPCTVEDGTHGLVRHQTQTIYTNGNIPHPQGSDVVLMLRPEELRLGEHGGQNRLTGTIQSVNFLGSVVRVQLNHAGTPITLDLFNERLLRLPEVGQTHTITFPPHACWVMSPNGHH